MHPILEHWLYQIEHLLTRIIAYGLIVALVVRHRNQVRSKRTFQRLDALFAPKRFGVYPYTASTPRVATFDRNKSNRKNNYIFDSDHIRKDKVYDLGIVCIGGFGDAPMYFDPLLECLQVREDTQFAQSSLNSDTNINNNTRKIFYYAPRTPGWARSSFDEAMRLSYEDWIVAAREAIHLATSLCHKVRIIAHSTGAIVVAAILLVESSKDNGSMCDVIDRVVFTGSNFLPAHKDVSVKRLLMNTPMIARTMKFVQPIIAKRLREGRPVDTVRKEYHSIGFYLMEFPLNAVIEMWKLQDWLLYCATKTGCRITFGNAKQERKLVFLQGEHDKSVAPLEEQVQYVRTQLLTKEIGNDHDILVENELIDSAAHNLCGESEIVLERIARALIEPLHHSPVDQG